MTLTASERTMRARAAAYAMHARHDLRKVTQPGRDAFTARFEKQVDPEGVLPEAERIRRAECAKKAHFTALAFQSAKARRQKKEREEL